MVLPKKVQKSRISNDVARHGFSLGWQLCEHHPNYTFNEFAQVFYKKYYKA